MQRKWAKHIQSQTDAARKRPLKPVLTHHEKMDASLLYIYFRAKDFFQIPERYSQGKNALSPTDNSPFKKLATEIKAFQSAFEVKDSAANGTSRQFTY